MPDDVMAHVRQHLPTLSEIHQYKDSVPWRLTPKGLEVNGTVAGTPGRLVTVPRVWGDYRVAMVDAAEHFGVPVELILATACTESGGDARALRKEPGYVSDEATPQRISPGLMQTLISTARSTLRDQGIDRAWLLDPANSITAGTSYIAEQSGQTHYDPPKVAAAYNAGAIYSQPGEHNRWKMRQYPIGTGVHVDRYVAWFNDAFRMFAGGEAAPAASFYALLNA